MISEQELEKQLVKLSRKYRLNPTFLREIIILRSRGINNLEISERTGIARVTVNNYVATLEEIDKIDLWRIIGTIIAIAGGTALLYSILKDDN